MPNPYYNEKKPPPYVPGYTDKPGESRRAFIDMLAAQQEAELAAHPESRPDLLPDADATEVRTTIKRLHNGGVFTRTTFFLGGRLYVLDAVYFPGSAERVGDNGAAGECSAAA